MSELEKKLKALPDHPGVYLLLAGDGEILYPVDRSRPDLYAAPKRVQAECGAGRLF